MVFYHKETIQNMQIFQNGIIQVNMNEQKNSNLYPHTNDKKQAVLKSNSNLLRTW